MKVVAYAWNHEGLGHVSRLMAILGALRERDASLQCLVLAEQESPLLEDAGWPHVGVPEFVRVYVGHEPEAAAHVLPPEPVARTLALALAGGVLDSMGPQVVVSDTVLWTPLFEAARARRIPQVLVLRRRSDMADYLRRTEAELRELAAIVLPHDRSEIPPGEVPASLEARVVYTGPIVRPSPSDASDDELRQRYGIAAGEDTVVVTGGGGGFAEHRDFFNLAAGAIARAASRPTLAILVLGCFFAGVADLPPAPHVRWRVTRHERDLARLMGLAGAVICQGGYNTMHEAAALQVPAVLLPGRRDFDDQHGRVRAAASLLDQAVVVERPTEDTVAAALMRLLEASDSAANRPGPRLDARAGRGRAAEAILECASTASRGEQA